jgi:hypothetical protein
MGKMKDSTIPEYDQHSHDPKCPCTNADDRGCFLISAETDKCVSCTCMEKP